MQEARALEDRNDDDFANRSRDGEDVSEEERKTDDEEIAPAQSIPVETENPEPDQSTEQQDLVDAPLPAPEAPPPPPPGLERAEEARGRIRRAAREGPAQDTIRVDLPHGDGSLVFYHGTNALQAHCKWPSHGDCRKQRTIVPGRRAGQGRPLGYLTAWLLDAHKHETQNEHNHRSVVTLEERQNARALLAGLPGSDDLFEKERPRADGEPDEPIRFS